MQLLQKPGGGLHKRWSLLDKVLTASHRRFDYLYVQGAFPSALFYEIVRINGIFLLREKEKYISEVKNHVPEQLRSSLALGPKVVE
ncbi:MAG TPA: hypothetical protein VK463_06140 [Desulfomonilaceae bacterium]|nr:hypothetical protein [Desulfomonilaceae bacterium]